MSKQIIFRNCKNLFKTMGKSKINKNNEETHQDFEIDPDFIEYIHGIVHDIDNDDETRVNLINNFISEIPEGRESIVAQHAQGSKILDSLIGFASAENFEKFTICLKDSRKLMLNKSSSFVLESCVKIAAIRALSAGNKVKEEENEEEPESKRKKFSKKSTDVNHNLRLEFKPNHIQYCNEFLLKLAKFALNNIEDLLTSQGNHFIRNCVLCLSGIVTHKFHDKSPVNQVNMKTEHGKQVPDEWIEIITDFASRLQQWPHFHQLAFEEKSSTFLQVLCQALHNTGKEKTLKKLIKNIMKNSFGDEDGQKPFSTKCSKFLLESMFQFCEEKQFIKIYEKYFKGKVTDMADDSECNFTIQRLLDYVKNKEIFEELFNQLSTNFSTLLQNGRTGVVLAVAKACERLSFKQGQLIQNLIKALESEKSPNHVIQCIATLMPASVVDQNSNYIEVHLHGSLILQSILRFNKPIKIVQSLLDIKPQTLSDIFCHPKGSRIADAFVESKFIGEKSREKLIKHLEGMYLKMAMSKNGSHVLEKFYQLSAESQKEVIVKELSERLNQLNSTVCGKIICYKFNVELYARNINQWKNFLTRPSK